ncbi:MAG TPA: hypothetical protein VNS61_06630 [Caldimonas sp.]|nr:hypothetical protein [Caldimonas sp.]
MSNVEIPDSLSIAGWEKQKSAMAKDKAVASKLQGETSKVAESVKALDKAQSSVDFSMFDPKGINSAAAAQAAIDKIEAAVKGDLKTLLTAAKSAGTSADTFVSACDKLRKTLKGDSEKIATAAWTATKAASSAATKFAADVGAAVTSAQAELEALCSKLKAGDKKTAAPNPKAAADGKAIGALIKKSIAALRSPKGSPLPVKFSVVRLEKKFRIYLGPKPESALAKLKTQFEPKAKIKLIKDPKGTVIWEKDALTFVSDKLAGVSAKLLQGAIREQTKLTAKVRIKKSDGKVDEADAADLKDTDLHVDADDEAALKVDLKDVLGRLAELKSEIEAAIKSGGDAKLKTLYASLQSHIAAKTADEASDDLDEIESLLAPADEDEGEGEQAESGADKGVAPAKAFEAKLAALMPKIRAAIAAGGDAADKIRAAIEAAAKLAKTEKDADVAKANLLLSEVEKKLGQGVGAAPSSGFSVQQLGKARHEWIATRDKAVSEITRLSRAIVDAYRGETDQQAQVKAAITKLAGLATRLKSGLDNDLDAALSAKDAASRTQLASKAKNSVKAIKKIMDEDELMQSLDGNEILGDMHVVAPMKERLSAIEAALG